MSNANTSLRTIVRGSYDIQKLRIMMGNRIVAQFKAKLGQKPSESEDEIDSEGKKLLEQLRDDFRLMMDGVKTVKLATFKATPLISTFTEFCLLQQYLDLEESEDRHFKNLGKILLEYPIFTEYLTHISGIGPAMAGVLISEIDIHKAKYVSSIWAYAGLDVAGDGNGRSRKEVHLVERSYVDKKGDNQTRMGITFNPFLKTKLLGVLGPAFLKAGLTTIKKPEVDDEGNPKLVNGKQKMVSIKDEAGNSIYDRTKCEKYGLIYVDYRHRLQNHPKWAGRPKAHVHNASIRYVVKMFLCDLYAAWKKIEGLPAEVPYHEAKLGLRHGQAG